MAMATGLRGGVDMNIHELTVSLHCNDVLLRGLWSNAYTVNRSYNITKIKMKLTVSLDTIARCT